MPWLKFVGIALMVFGFWLIKVFPSKLDFQRLGFTRSGIFIGIISLLLGFIMLLVG